MDIVERLRKWQSLETAGIHGEAADEIERLRAEVAALKAPVGMEPDRGISYFCNKCGYFGDTGPSHVKGNGKQCDYLASSDGPWYSAAQLAQVQRERDAYKKDAERYRWLRMCDWFSSTLCVVADPKVVLTGSSGLGADCPSRERLDAAIDAAMQKEKECPECGGKGCVECDGPDHRSA